MFKNLFYLFALLLLVSCGEKNTQKWEAYTEPQKRFSLEYPRGFQPYRQVMETDSAGKAAGAVPQEDFMFRDEKSGQGSSLSVRVVVLTPDVQKLSRQDIYTNLAANKDLPRKQITYQGLDAIEIEGLASPGMKMRSIYLLSKDNTTMYVVVAGGSSEFIASETTQKFIDSFKLQ